METGTFLSEKAKELIADIRNADGYGYGWLNRQATIGDAICKMRVFQFENDTEREALSSVVLVLSEYNELLKALSEEVSNG